MYYGAHFKMWYSGPDAANTYEYEELYCMNNSTNLPSVYLKPILACTTTVYGFLATIDLH